MKMTLDKLLELILDMKAHGTPGAKHIGIRTSDGSPTCNLSIISYPNEILIEESLEE